MTKQSILLSALNEITTVWKKKCVFGVGDWWTKLLAQNRILMRRPNSIYWPKVVLAMHRASVDRYGTRFIARLWSRVISTPTHPAGRGICLQRGANATAATATRGHPGRRPHAPLNTRAYITHAHRMKWMDVQCKYINEFTLSAAMCCSENASGERMPGFSWQRKAINLAVFISSWRDESWMTLFILRVKRLFQLVRTAFCTEWSIFENWNWNFKRRHCSFAAERRVCAFHLNYESFPAVNLSVTPANLKNVLVSNFHINCVHPI